MQHKIGLVFLLAQAGFCLGLAALLEFKARNFSLSCPAYLFSAELLLLLNYGSKSSLHVCDFSHSFFASGS